MRMRKKRRGKRSAERAYMALLRDREAERAMFQWFCQRQGYERFGKGVIGYV